MAQHDNSHTTQTLVNRHRQMFTRGLTKLGAYLNRDKWIFRVSSIDIRAIES